MLKTGEQVTVEGWVYQKQPHLWAITDTNTYAGTRVIDNFSLPSRQPAHIRTQLAKHAFAVAQAFHGYYQDPRYSVLHAENEDRRAFRALLVDAFLRQMEVLTALLGIPIPDKM